MRESHPRLAPLLIAALVIGSNVPAAAQVTAGQRDTFQDGTTADWIVSLLGLGSHPAPPTNVAGGGPGGAGDAFLLLTAIGGTGAGARLSAINGFQWSGNYTAAGIIGISMWVNNFGPDDLFLRLAFEQIGPMGPTNIAFTANAIFVAALGGWTQINFSLRPGALLAAVGSVDAAMTNVNALRIYHSPDPNVPNPFMPIPGINVQVGIDDIAANAVPEPISLVLLGSGLVGVAAARRRRRTIHKND